MRYFWKPMPYYILRDEGKISHFKRRDLSASIAALKIYILICLYSNDDDEGGYCAMLTYDQLSRLASLSRMLVSKGLRSLSDAGLIESVGVKKKKYYLIGVKNPKKEARKVRFKASMGYWAKLPYSGFVDESGRVVAFESIKNRSCVEFDALRIFIYLLYIRGGGNVYIKVSLGRIKRKLGISFSNILSAISFMQSVGMLYKVNLGANTIHDYDSSSTMTFLTCGWESLVWKPNYLSNEDWKDTMFSQMF